MESLVIYFNELCLQKSQDKLIKPPQWELYVKNFVDTVEATIAIRPDCRIGFSYNIWHADCGGMAFSERIRLGLAGTKDRYRRLLAKIKQIDNIELARDVQFKGTPAMGLIFADLAANAWSHGWVVSLAIPNSPWIMPKLPVQRWLLDDTGMITGPSDCEVGNLSKMDHVQHWSAEIQDWGSVIASSSFLGLLDGHPIVMYSAPLEHEPPHLHLLESVNYHRTLAKYEIEPFARPWGPDTWDSSMRAWISDYKEQLLRSWKRCQRGGHPYELEN